MRKTLVLLVLLILALAGVALADSLTLLDGTVIEGRIVPQGDKYWIKLPNGQTRTYSKGEVKAYSKAASATPAPATVTPQTPTPATPTPAAPATPATNAATPAGATATFAETKSKTNLV